MLRTHGPAVGSRQLAELKAQQAAAEEAGKDELCRELKQLVADTEKHLATVRPRTLTLLTLTLIRSRSRSVT
eukprot:2340075-Prymnesium_polylepis.1